MKTDSGRTLDAILRCTPAALHELLGKVYDAAQDELLSVMHATLEAVPSPAALRFLEAIEQGLQDARTMRDANPPLDLEEGRATLPKM